MGVEEQVVALRNYEKYICTGKQFCLSTVSKLHFYLILSYLIFRPGVEAKPGAKLGQTASASASNTKKDSTNRAARDRVPESLRKEAKGRSNGSYFGSRNAADSESEATRKEAQKRAKETDKISAGAGNRRREIENKLSPNMRNKAAAAQQTKAEKMQERKYRRARATVARRYARPVEKVLSIYNSQSTDLYDVLDVGRIVKDETLKKAYRKLALLVHPGIKSSTQRGVTRYCNQSLIS